MVVGLIITVFYLIAYLFEVYHDDIQRKINNLALNYLRQLGKVTEISIVSKEDELMDYNEEWHTWDWRKQATTAICVAVAVFSLTNDFKYFILPIMIGLERMLVLNIGGNIKAKRDWLYLGLGKSDKLLKKWFGNFWPLAVFTAFLGCFSILIWF